MTKPKQAATPAERVRASEARKLEAGGRRMPGGVMPSDASIALESLQAAQYAEGASACIFRAVIEASKRQRRRKAKG